MKNILFKLRILFLAPVIAFGMDNQAPSTAEENIIVFLPDDVVKHIFSFLPITELQVFWINKQWYSRAQEADVFKGYVNFLKRYQEIKANCHRELPSIAQAVDIIHELRVSFAALPASKGEKAQLAEAFESKYSLPVILICPNRRAPEKISPAQAQKLERAVQEHFLILAMMRIHREQGCQDGMENWQPFSTENLCEQCGILNGHEQFIKDFSIHPLLMIIAPTSELIKSFTGNNGDDKIVYAKALCDRGCKKPLLEKVHSSDDTLSNKELAQILFERGQNITSAECIRLGTHFSANNERTTACAWHKRALAQGLDDDGISERELVRAGYAFFLLKDFASAAQCYEKALEKRPQGCKAIFFVNGGNTHYHSNDMTKAASWYKKAMAINIEEILPHSLVQAGWTFFFIKDYALAIQCYEKALEKLPQGFNAGFFLVVGTAYAHMNNVAQAVHYFKIGIDMMIQDQKEYQHRLLDYLLIKDFLVKDGAPQKYVDWVQEKIHQSQQPAGNAAQDQQ